MNAKEYDYKGKKYSLRQLVDLSGIHISTEGMRYRIKNLGLEQAMNKANPIEKGLMNLDFSEWDNDLGLKRQIKNWLAIKMPVEEMIIKTRVCR